MRKIVKLPDGREEIFEGTPEEIAEMEKRLREEGVKPSGKGRRLLKETEKKLADLEESMKDSRKCPCDGCQKFQELMRTSPQVVPMPYPYPVYPPIQVEPYPVPPWRITDIICTTTTTSDGIVFKS